VVTALIVFGVIVFLAVDAYVLYRVFAGRRRAADYGSFPAPGEIQVMLPAGRVKLSYQESYRASGDAETGIDFGVPRGLQVGVVSPEGESVEIKGPGFRGMGASIDLGSGWSRALVGTVEIAQAGEYTISVRAAPADAVEPQMLVGR
jgi:hypothetical protein